MEEEFIIRGSLEESTVPELLRSVSKNKESGVLTCYIREYTKRIFMEKGQIVFATSTCMDDRLGEFLLRSGRITVRSFLDATKVVRPGRRLGAILCENQMLSADELIDGVRDQVRHIIISIFDCVKGTYELLLKPNDTQEMILLNSPTEDIIFDGIKSITSWSRISKGIGSFSSVLLPGPDAPKIILNLTLSPEESHLISLIEKGHFTVEEICSMSYLTNFETCRLLWALQLIGAVIESPESIETQADLTRYVPSSSDVEADLHDLLESYNNIYSCIYEYAQQKLGDEEADRFAIKAVTQVQDTMPNVTRSLRFDTYGRLDFDTILKNLSPISESERFELLGSALEEIVYALQAEADAVFGPLNHKELFEQVEHLRKAIRK
jgi:uncharacterized protein DUF4388